MKKRDEITDQTSCLNKAEDDEPVFVLRANDEFAPEVVRHWSAHYLVSKSDRFGRVESLTPEQRAKYEEALALATAMVEWKKRRDAGGNMQSSIDSGS